VTPLADTAKGNRPSSAAKAELVNDGPATIVLDV
jgi:D-Tyr-tRNAtyr deacylase